MPKDIAWLILGAVAVWVFYLFAARPGLRRLFSEAGKGLALGILASIGLLAVLWALITVITG